MSLRAISVGTISYYEQMQISPAKGKMEAVPVAPWGSGNSSQLPAFVTGPERNFQTHVPSLGNRTLPVWLCPLTCTETVGLWLGISSWQPAWLSPGYTIGTSLSAELLPSWPRSSPMLAYLVSDLIDPLLTH